MATLLVLKKYMEVIKQVKQQHLLENRQKTNPKLFSTSHKPNGNLDDGFNENFPDMEPILRGKLLFNEKSYGDKTM